MQSVAIVMQEPGRVEVESVDLVEPGPGDVVVAVDWSGISTGTERLLWQGRMPSFPGLGYPLVPGYEAVGRVAACGRQSSFEVGDTVFVPGSNGFKSARALFGGSARTLIVSDSKAIPLGSLDGPEATLLALAATAHHVRPTGSGSRPDLIVGHGVLGRLLARLTLLDGGPPPVVWETNQQRRSGGVDYPVLDPTEDLRRDYRCICDVSGDATLLDALIQRLAPGGEIVLAGFYSTALSFDFPPAFQREMRLRIAAQFLPADVVAVRDLARSGRLSLDGLITHRSRVDAAAEAYRTAFESSECLKMVLDWRQIQ